MTFVKFDYKRLTVSTLLRLPVTALQLLSMQIKFCLLELVLQFPYNEVISI